MCNHDVIMTMTTTIIVIIIIIIYNHLLFLIFKICLKKNIKKMIIFNLCNKLFTNIYNYKKQ